MYFRSTEGRHRLLANASQVGVPSIARPVTYLRTIELVLPPLREQAAIADILGTLDDKIELNRRMNNTLNAMAQALFKSWFVDFEPVRAKILKQDAGLPQSIASVFPNELANSEIGPIPKGWKVTILGQLLDLAYGKSLKADSRLPGTIPVYGSNGRVGWHNKALVRGPGIIVGRKGNPGTVAWAATSFYPIDTTFYVVPKGPEDTLCFLHYALVSQNLPLIAADSAVPGLNRNLAYMNTQLLPPYELIRYFNAQVGPLLERCHHLDVEARTLSLVRDALLPELISGNLRVEDANTTHLPRRNA